VPLGISHFIVYRHKTLICKVNGNIRVEWHKRHCDAVSLVRHNSIIRNPLAVNFGFSVSPENLIWADFTNNSVLCAFPRLCVFAGAEGLHPNYLGNHFHSLSTGRPA
jgi:hypothetical protein